MEIINERYAKKLIHKYLLIIVKEKDNKERNKIILVMSSLYFLDLTEKGIANLGTIVPRQFKYLKARSL